MRATVDRLAVELDGDHLDGHRLREIETVLRLLMRHLNRAVADALHRLGSSGVLEDASGALRRMREAMTWVEANREASDLWVIQTRLLDAARSSRDVLAVMERL